MGRSRRTLEAVRAEEVKSPERATQDQGSGKSSRQGLGAKEGESTGERGQRNGD